MCGRTPHRLPRSSSLAPLSSYLAFLAGPPPPSGLPRRLGQGSAPRSRLPSKVCAAPSPRPARLPPQRGTGRGQRGASAQPRTLKGRQRPFLPAAAGVRAGGRRRRRAARQNPAPLPAQPSPAAGAARTTPPGALWGSSLAAARRGL